MARIKKVRDWKFNRPQFEFVPDERGYKVVRLNDDIVFKVDFPYIFKDGRPIINGYDISFFYITSFNSVDKKTLTFSISSSRADSINAQEGECEINSLFYKKDGILEIISLYEI